MVGQLVCRWAGQLVEKMAASLESLMVVPANIMTVTILTHVNEIQAFV